MMVPTLLSDLTKCSTLDILKNLENIVINNWQVDLEDFTCDDCGALIEQVSLPIKFNSAHLRDIHDMLKELIQRHGGL